MKKFVYIGESRCEIRGVGVVDGFGSKINLPDELADLWKKPGGPTIMPEAMFENCNVIHDPAAAPSPEALAAGKRAVCREALSDARLGITNAPQVTSDLQTGGTDAVSDNA